MLQATFTSKLDVVEVHRQNRLGQVAAFRSAEKLLRQALRERGYTVVEDSGGWDVDYDTSQYTYTIKAERP